MSEHASTPTPKPRRRWAFVVRVLVAVLVLGGLAAGVWTWVFRSHDAAADRALRAFDLDAAQQHGDLCLSLWPFSPGLYLRSARIARARGDFALAERRLDACARLKHSSPELTLERRLLRAQQGDLGDVEGPLRQLLAEGHPAEPQILEALAAGYVADDRLPEAKFLLDRLLKKDPDDVPGLLLRAEVLSTASRNEEALPDLRHAVDVAPSSDAAHLALGQMLFRLGFQREAVGHLEWVLRRDPDRPEVVLALAVCRFDAGERAEAERLLDGLLQRHPDHPSALAERARLALHAGDSARAEELCRRALDVAPRDREAWQVLALALRALGRTAEADRARDQLGRIEGAGQRLRDLFASLEQTPNDPDLHAQVAAAFLELGATEQAERHVRQALAIDPRHAAAHRLLDRLGTAAGPDSSSPPLKP